MYNSIAAVIAFASLANASGVVHLPFERHARQAPADSLAKRSANAVTLPEEYNKYYYVAEVKVGTPPQTVKVELDTSSTDVMFMDSDFENCANFTDEYIPFGFPGYPRSENISCWKSTIFNSSNSKTLQSYVQGVVMGVDQSTEYNNDWLDGTYVMGDHYYDTLQIADSVIHNYSIGSNYAGNHTMSVLGLGLLNDAYIAFEVMSLPDAMVENNITSFNGYSIYLNSKDSNEGSVIFGGIDHSKYEGTLQTIPITNNEYSDFFAEVMVNGISLYDGSESVEVASFALSFGLTTDYFYTVLPTPFVDAIAQSIGGERYGKYILVPCDISGGLTFNLSGSNISVPFDEMVFPLEDGTCHLAITDTTDADYYEGTYSKGSFYLGESFMRAAYVVYNFNANGEDEYDLESRTIEISIAKAKYNASSNSVEAITGNSVPSATRAPYYSHTNDSSHWATTVYSNFITVSNTSLGGSSFTDAPINVAYINSVNQTGSGTTITTAHATGVDSSASASTGSAAAAGANGAASASGASGAASASSSSSSSKGSKKKNGASHANVPTMVTASTLFFGAFVMAIIA